MPPDASKALQRCAEARADVIKADLLLPRAEGKKVLLEVINGGSPPAPLASNPVVVGLQSACIWLKWLAISNLPELYEHCEKMKPIPANSIVAYLYQAVEDLVLSSWATYLASLDLTHLSLHFDGCRIQARDSCPLSIPDLCRDSANWIAQQTGFSVTITEKKHFLLQELLLQRAEVLEKMDLHPVLLKGRNCIPTCLAFLTGRWSDMQELAERDEADTHDPPSYRSFKGCFELAAVDVRPEAGCDTTKHGKAILNVEHDGLPLAIALILPDDEARPIEVFLCSGVRISITRAAFEACLADCVDSFSLVTFWLEDPGHDFANSPAMCLMELQAGADCQGGAEEFLCECEGRLEDSDNEGAGGEDYCESEVRIGDILLGLLARERTQAIENGIALTAGKLFRCPLCPFRAFTRRCRVTDHIRKYHSKKRQFAASGKKQIRIIQALFDDDQMQCRPIGPNYLKRSAAALRASLCSMDTSVNDIDRLIRLVLTEHGPSYKSHAAVMSKPGTYRRAMNLFYTHGFACLLFQEILTCHAKMKQVPCRAVVLPK